MKMKNKFSILFLCFACIPLLITSIILLIVINKYTRADAEGRLNENVVYAQKMIDSKIEIYQQYVEELGKNRVIADYVLKKKDFWLTWFGIVIFVYLNKN